MSIEINKSILQIMLSNAILYNLNLCDFYRKSDNPMDKNKAYKLLQLVAFDIVKINDAIEYCKS
jgi:hypothetical protein